MNKARREALNQQKETAFVLEQTQYAKLQSSFLPHIFKEVPNPQDGIAGELEYPRYVRECEISIEHLQALDKLEQRLSGSGRSSVLGAGEPGALKFPERHGQLPPKLFTARGQVAIMSPFNGHFFLSNGSYQDELFTCENAVLLYVWSALARTDSIYPKEWMDHYKDVSYAIIIGSSASTSVENIKLPPAPGYHLMKKNGKTLVSRIHRPLDQSILYPTMDRWETFHDVSEW
jgi:hypothetical protein